MAKNKFTVTTEPAEKVTAAISRYQMWKNFLDCWGDIQWDEFRGVDHLKEVADVLLSGESVSKNVTQIRKLFRDGNTVFFMGEAMRQLDRKDILREIVVQDLESGSIGKVVDYVFVHHEDIEF